MWRNKDQGENNFIVFLKISALKISALGFRRDSKVDFTQNFETTALKSLSAALERALACRVRRGQDQEPRFRLFRRKMFPMMGNDDWNKKAGEYMMQKQMESMLGGMQFGVMWEVALLQTEQQRMHLRRSKESCVRDE